MAEPEELPIEALGALAVGAVAFVSYGVAAAPAPYLLDSAELAEAAFGLGIAHPPGETVSALWGRLFAFLPLGSVAFRVALGQAAAGAVATALVFHLVWRLGAGLDPAGRVRPALRALVAAAAGLLYGLSPGALLTANRPEVYALQTALSLGALALARRGAETGDQRLALAAAFAIALGLANHPLIAGLAGLGAVAAAWPLLRLGPGRLVAGGVLALLAGLLVLVYIPLRASAGPALSWGDARTLERFLWVVTARTFAEKSGIVHGSAEPGSTPFVLMEEVGILPVLLSLAGAFVVLRDGATRPAGSALLVGLAGALVAALINGLDPANPDVRGYLGPVVALLAVLAGAAVLALAASLRSLAAQALVAGAALLGAGAGLPSAVAAASRRHSVAADVSAFRLLTDVPPGGVLLTSHFETAFLVGYLRTVEGQRPDVAWAHLGFVRGPGYAERTVSAEPDLGPLLRAYARGEPLGAALEELDRLRPLRVEVNPTLEPSLLRLLAPAGLTWGLATGPYRRVRSQGTGSGEALPGTVALERLLAPEVAADRQVRGAVAWRAYADLHAACVAGFPETARLARKRLEALVPQDERARALIARCPVLHDGGRH